MSENLVEIRDLFVQYTCTGNILGKKEYIYAVNGVNLDIKKGEIFAIAGESGCGKSTLAKTIIQLEPACRGKIYYNGKNIYDMDKQGLKNFRKNVQMIFQNPYSSLDPKMKIFDTLKEPLKINTKLNEVEIEKIVTEVACKAGLDRNCLDLYPHEFSGGQRQRIAIARALVLNPEFILADEPVSALDVSIRAQIINLLKDLKNDFDLTFMFISHDLSVIKYISDRAAIMYLGEIVEIGCTAEIFSNPKHPYTQALLSSVPGMKKNKKEKIVLKGDLPSPSNLPSGCKFNTRCPYVMMKCRECCPPDIKFSETHSAKCFLYE